MREQLFSRQWASLTSACTSWLGPRVTWLLINYSYYALQTGGNRCGSDAGASCLPLIYHIQESNYRCHIFLSLLCQAISRILRTMAFLLPKGDTPQRSCGGSLSQTPLRCVSNEQCLQMRRPSDQAEFSLLCKSTAAAPHVSGS